VNDAVLSRWIGDTAARLVPVQTELALSRAEPALFEHLVRTQPALVDAMGTLDGKLVVPPTSGTSGSHLYRLQNHNRSFCLAVTADEDVYSASTIVLKGVEPWIDDFPEYVRWLSVSPFRQSTRTMAEHFPLAEGKIPGATSLREIRHEAELALDVQRKHLQHYGELAHVPLPLFTYKLGTDGPWRTALKSHLSSAAFDRIEPLLNEGIGVLAYFYPAVPARADHVAGDRKLTDYLKTAYPVDQTIGKWVTLLARIMLLGYMPLTPLHDGLGGCMDAGNATLDGGFCDLDSLIPLAECADDELFHAGVLISLRELRETCLRVLSPGMGIAGSRIYPHNDEFVVTQYLVHELRRALEREARPGLVADARFAALLAPADLATVMKLLDRKPRPRTFKAFTARR
jgi:hypothetical protein